MDGSMLFDRWRQHVPHEGMLAPTGEYDWICASFGPLESTTQTTNRSVKPFLHSWRQEVPVIYSGRPHPPELPLQMGDLDSHVTRDALGSCEPTTQTAPRSVQPCLHRRSRSVAKTLKLHITSALRCCQAAVMVLKNGEMVATVWAESIPYWSTASNVAVLHLERGDQVWLLLLNRASHLHGYMYTTFSGTVLFPL